LSQESFFSWIDIQEYRGIPTLDYRRSKLNHIFKKYIMQGAVLQLGFLEEVSEEGWVARSEATVKHYTTFLHIN